jgi:hypothetical protein
MPSGISQGRRHLDFLDQEAMSCSYASNGLAPRSRTNLFCIHEAGAASLNGQARLTLLLWTSSSKLAAAQSGMVGGCGYDTRCALEDSTRGRVFAARRSSSGCTVGSLHIARISARPTI